MDEVPFGPTPYTPHLVLLYIDISIPQVTHFFRLIARTLVVYTFSSVDYGFKKKFVNGTKPPYIFEPKFTYSFGRLPCCLLLQIERKGEVFVVGFTEWILPLLMFSC